MSSTRQFLADTHCHLNLSAFEDDRQDVLQRARTSGVRAILVLGIDLETSREAIRLAEREAGLFAAVGIHPHDSGTWSETNVQSLQRLVDEHHVVAVGEIGLDYYRDYASREAQCTAFTRQLEFAAAVERPVAIHQRASMEDVMNILSDWVETLPPSLRQRPGVLHAFSGDQHEAERAVELGFYLGIGGPITFRKADRLKQVVEHIPLEHLVLETDSPYLAPQPVRGKRNEPAHLSYIAEAVATIKGTTLDTVMLQTTRNADHLFQWSKGPGDTKLS